MNKKDFVQKSRTLKKFVYEGVKEVYSLVVLYDRAAKEDARKRWAGLPTRSMAKSRRVLFQIVEGSMMFFE